MFSVHVMESKKNPWQAISFKKLFTTGLSFLFCQAGLTVLGICLILPFTMTTPHLAAFILLAYLLIIVTPYNLLFIQRLPENKLPAFRHTFEYFKKNWLHVLDITGAAVVLSLFFSYWGQFLNWISFSLVDLGQSTLFWSVNLLLLIFDLIVRVYLFFFFMYFAGMIAAKTRSDK